MLIGAIVETTNGRSSVKQASGRVMIEHEEDLAVAVPLTEQMLLPTGEVRQVRSLEFCGLEIPLGPDPVGETRAETREHRLTAFGTPLPVVLIVREHSLLEEQEVTRTEAEAEALAEQQLAELEQKMCIRDSLEARQEHSTVTTTPLARKVLFQGQTVRMRTRHIPEERLTAHKMQEFGPVDEALFQSLRRVRMAEARKAGVPAYAIFSDAALRAMAAAKPHTEAEFLAIPGVGEVKLRRFGSLFLEEIRKSAEK